MENTRGSLHAATEPEPKLQDFTIRVVNMQSCMVDCKKLLPVFLDLLSYDVCVDCLPLLCNKDDLKIGKHASHVVMMMTSS